MKNPSAKILIIDDEPQIRSFLKTVLQANEYQVVEAGTAEKGLEAVALETPTLILLDLGLPDKDGLEVLKNIRSWGQIPVIIISVRDSVEDVVQALELGADDYITKPFNIAELIARLRTALRKASIDKGQRAVMQFQHLTIDFAHRKVSVSGEVIKLTKKEYDIIETLATNAGKVITQTQLLKDIWGEVYQENVEYLRTYVAQLRKKIELDYKHPQIILTEIGIGYRFCDPTHKME